VFSKTFRTVSILILAGALALGGAAAGLSGCAPAQQQPAPATTTIR